MGSVNRDFVFRELQAGKHTHNSHMDARAYRHTLQRGGGMNIYGRLHTVQQIQRKAHMHVQRLQAHANTHLNGQTN